MKMDGYDGDFLSKEEILLTHDRILEKSEVNDEAGFIDGDGKLFESAVYGIFAAFGGREFYPSIEEKACRLCFAIISNHCFKNANKRTGYMCLKQTLDLNGYNSSFDEDELYEILNSIGDNSKKDEAAQEDSYKKLLHFVRKYNSCKANQLNDMLNDESMDNSDFIMRDEDVKII